MQKTDLVMRLFETTQVLQREIQLRLMKLELPGEITGQRLRVLWEISAAGSLKMSDLAARMGIQPRTVTQFIDALETAGLVTRTPDPQDRRATLLRLTESAQAVVDIFHGVVKNLNEKIELTVGSQDRDRIVIALIQIETLLTSDQ